MNNSNPQVCGLGMRHDLDMLHRGTQIALSLNRVFACRCQTATTMASKLADELLQMIIAPSLTIFHEKFISPSPTAFGENDTVSSASALLVCKRWLRVATPLLYEVKGFPT